MRVLIAGGVIAVLLIVGYQLLDAAGSTGVAVAILAVLAQIGWLVVAWFRSADCERWARSAAWTVRGFMVITALIAFLAVLGGPGDDFTTRFEIGPVEVVDRAVSVEVEGTQSGAPITLCPPRAVPVRGQSDTFFERSDRSCRQWRTLRASYGPNAYVREPMPVRVRIEDPSRGDRLRLGALQVLGWTAFLLGVLAVERMLSSAARREPFARRNVGWMRVVALSVAVYALLLPLAMRPVASALMARTGSDYGTEGWKGFSVEVQPVWPDNLLWWIVPAAIVLALLALAEVWRAGIILQDDAEATV